ncbi:MAG: pilus assembly protein [Chloroflexota bacterium]|nr:pilus assembly protein [Chloroflexota bacterium]
MNHLVVRRSARQHGQRAQSLVEFALIVPVTLLLLLGMIDLGRAFVFGVAVQGGAREAARLGSKAALDLTVTDAVILRRLIDASSPALDGCLPQTGTQPAGGCAAWTFTITPSGARSGGDTLTVTAVGRPSLLSGINVGGFSLAQITVQGQAAMTVW